MHKSLMRASLTFFLILFLSLPCLGRYYDAGIGRFLIPDPHADNYPSMSPYHYCLNDPINKIDPNGLDTYNVDENGDVTVQEGHWWNPWSWKHGVFSDNVTMNGETYKMSDVSVVTQNYIGMKLTDPASLDAIQAVPITQDPVFIGLTIGLTASIKTTTAATEVIGYHATTQDAAEAILNTGFRLGTKPGRLGSGGVYVNNTVEGAVAEFSAISGGKPYSVLQVRYNPGINALSQTIPKGYRMSFPLNVESISATSVRLQGTINTNILNGTAVPLKIIK